MRKLAKGWIPSSSIHPDLIRTVGAAGACRNAADDASDVGADVDDVVYILALKFHVFQCSLYFYDRESRLWWHSASNSIIKFIGFIICWINLWMLSFTLISQTESYQTKMHLWWINPVLSCIAIPSVRWFYQTNSPAEWFSTQVSITSMHQSFPIDGSAIRQTKATFHPSLNGRLGVNGP